MFVCCAEGSPQFIELKQAFLATGRGRRKDISLPVDNKLLLQVYILKEGSGKSWPVTEAFLQKILGRVVPKDRMRTLTEKAVREVEKQAPHLLPSFLSTVVDIDGLGERLVKAGFTKDSLLSSSFDVRDSVPSNGLFIELGRFQQKENLPSKTLLGWFCQLTGVTAELPEGTTGKTKKWIQDITRQMKKLQSNRGKPGGSAALESFSNAPFVIPGMFKIVESLLSSSTSDEQCGTSTSLPAPSASTLCGSLQSTIAALRRDADDCRGKISDLQSQITVLTEERRASCREVKITNNTNVSLVQEIVHEKKVSFQLQQANSSLHSIITGKDRQLKTLKRRNAVQRNEQIDRQLQINVDRLQQKYRSALQQKMKVTKSKSYVEKKLETTVKRADEYKKERATLRVENKNLQNRITELEAMLEERRVIRLKHPETGYFTNDAKVCIMELVGQHEIAAGRCGEVIHSVCRNVLSASIPEDDLPSERSVGRFVDMGQVLGKIQVASALTNSERFDLHTDATSRVGKKYVGQQVTTDSGQNLSCGYTVVATENADCLVSLATDLLEELAVIYEDDDTKRQEKFMEFLQKLSGLMSDRAAVMKCFNERLSTLRKDLLQTDEDLDFLYCNAHVLLGFSSAVVKVLRDMDSDVNTGRDLSAKFAGSSREHPVSRYVREACSCLGPRGDERYGCRESWLAFCLMIQRHSKITSFKANRFNNLFEASAALHFHQSEITTFFDTCMTDLNWKQEGLLLDSQSNVIDNHLVALGLIFFRFTGPYWRLLGTPLHHLDFYTHVKTMKEFLERWAVNPDDAFAEDFQDLFGVNMDCKNDDVFKSLINTDGGQKNAVCEILKALSTGFLAVIELQLRDFLPEGRYHAVDSAELRQKLQHSKLTNLVGEQAFGDLDFSMFKRRSATAHYHSSINILKRNKTLTDWFQTLSPEDQAAALVRAAAKHQQLRKEKRRAEEEALVMRRQILEDNRRKKAAHEEKRSQKKIMIIERLKRHNGPCSNSADVRNLLKTYCKKGERLLAVQAELQYHSTILQRKSPLLQVSKKMPQLIKNLRQFLGGEAESSSEDEEMEDHVPSAVVPPPRKRRRVEYICTSSSCSTSQSEAEEEKGGEEGGEEDLTSLAKILDFSFTFKAVGPGTLVAAVFEDDFYVGEVEERMSSDTALVNFMCRCAGKDTVYKWPVSPDRCCIDEKFVIAANFEMLSTNGRFWTLSKEDGQNIVQKFHAYRLLYFN